MSHSPLFSRPLILGLPWLVAAAALSATSFVAAKDPPKNKVRQHKVVKAPKPQDGGSTESTHDRERRLLRECKGRVNAGACAGYTG